MQKNKGITLVALTVTIISMLIVASISINASIGENGIITRTAQKKQDEIQKEVIEDIKQAESRMKYYEVEKGDKTLSLMTMSGIESLQKYLTGRINGVTFLPDGKSSIMFYENEKGKFTLKYDSETNEYETYEGFYLSKGSCQKINIEDDESLKFTLEGGDDNVSWYVLGDNDSFELVGNEISRSDYGQVTLYGFTKETYEKYSNNLLLGNADYIVDVMEKADERSVTQKISDYKDPINEKYHLGNNVYARVAGKNQNVLIVYVDEKETCSNPGYIYTTDFSLGSVEANENIDTLLLGEGVVLLNGNALDNFDNIKEITLPTTLKYVLPGAFSNLDCVERLYYNCENLEVTSYIIELNGKKYEFLNAELCKLEVTNLYIGDSVKYIQPYSFESSLVEIVTIAGNVKQIDDGAFYGSSLLRSVYFENGLKSIDYKAFYGCNLKVCNLSTSCETIDGYAFYNNQELARLTFGNVKTIGERAFYYAGITDVKLPNTLKTLGDYAFLNCRSLEKIDFGNSVESIGSECFWNCSKIKKIVLPDSVLTVGRYAFDTITDLEEITFGKNITYMPGYVIYSCPNIKTLYYNCLNCQHGEFFINEKLQYANAAPMLSSETRVNKVVVGNGVTKIPGSIFFRGHIEEVVLSNSVTEIGDSAFMNSYVKNINLDNIKTVGVFGFAYCHNLQNVNLNSIEVIKAKAFYYCDDFTSLTLPECLVELNAASFSGCDSIETLYYNAKHCEGHFTGAFWGDTQSYTYYPFQWWDRQTGSAMRANIADIRIGNTVEYLCDDIFRHNGDEEIIIPSSVTYITPSSGSQDGTFCNCPDVKRLIVKKPEGSIEGAPWSNTGTITVIWDPE